MPTCIRSYSKINLGLAIGPVRADGFHGLTTLYQTLAAHDRVTVAAERLGLGERRRITIACSDRRVPLDGRNTVWKMLEKALALEPFSSHGWAVRVGIEKRLPLQGGLGAGSANAAAALVALERETGMTFAGGERLRIAAEVGSDVPMFLIGGAVLGLGRGEQVYPMPDLVAGDSPVTVVLAFPAVGVSTPQAFRDWDHLESIALPPAASTLLTGRPKPNRLEELSRALAASLCELPTSSGVFPPSGPQDHAGHILPALVRTGIRNDFEEVVFRQHPFLGTIKRALLGRHGESLGESAPTPGVLYAALSGSGSALFGLYAADHSAAEAERRLHELGVRTWRTRLLTRAAYWQQMFESDTERRAAPAAND